MTDEAATISDNNNKGKNKLGKSKKMKVIAS